MLSGCLGSGFSPLFKLFVIVFKPRPKPTYRPTTDPNENFKKAILIDVIGEFLLLSETIPRS